MNKSLADFVHAPLEYDISEMMGEDEITDMAYQVEMLRKELYEASGRNRNYHVKAEDVKMCIRDRNDAVSSWPLEVPVPLFAACR